MADLPQTPILSTADPQWSIAELFNRDPNQLRLEHPDQFKRLILEYRAQAERNHEAEAAGKKPALSPKLKDKLPVKFAISAEELLFGIQTEPESNESQRK